MKILIFGAGVIGSIYASRLYEAHHDVTLLARSSLYENITRNGVTIRNTLTKKQTNSFIPCIRELKPTDAFDLVVVTVRLDQVGSVIPALRANQCCPLLLFMLNNPAGTPQLVQELGPKHILLGFPGVGGVYHDGCIDYVQIKQQSTTIGEINGEKSTCVREIKTILESADFTVDVNDDMPSWLKTHAVFISCMTAAILQENGDSVQLANNRFAVRQLVVSIREGFNACKALGISIRPGNLYILFMIMPRWFSILYWRLALKGKTGTLAIAPHANAAKDEMRLLAEKVISMVRSSPRPTPTLDKLLSRFIQNNQYSHHSSRTQRPGY
jgi:2-dehydropantoate 2-reductase